MIKQDTGHLLASSWAHRCVTPSYKYTLAMHTYVCVCVLVHTHAYTHTFGHHTLLCSYLKIYLFLAPYSEGNHYIMSIYLIKKLIVYDVPIEVEFVIYNF